MFDFDVLDRFEAGLSRLETPVPGLPRDLGAPQPHEATDQVRGGLCPFHKAPS